MLVDITAAEPRLTSYKKDNLTGQGVTDNVNLSEIFWHYKEMANVNVLELKAICYGIKIYCKNNDFKHFKFMCIITQQKSTTWTI